MDETKYKSTLLWCLLVMLCTGCVSAEKSIENMSHKVVEVNGECFVVVVVVVGGGGAGGIAMSPVPCVAEE